MGFLVAEDLGSSFAFLQRLVEFSISVNKGMFLWVHKEPSMQLKCDCGPSQYGD